MEKLKEFREIIEKIQITYDYEETYKNLYNATIDYMNDTQNWNFEDIFENVIDYELAEDRAKYELENGGLIRLYYFLGDCNFHNEIFRVNRYGNLEDITIEDLKYIKEEIIDRIDEELEG